MPFKLSPIWELSSEGEGVSAEGSAGQRVRELEGIRKVGVCFSLS